MSTKKLILLLVVFGVIGAGVYFYSAYKSGKIAQPEIRSIKHEWGDVNVMTTEIKSTAEIFNPNPVSIPIKRINIEIFMNGIKMAEGQAENINLNANQISKIEFYSKLDNQKIPEWWYTHIKNNENSEVLIKGTAYFEILGKEIPLSFDKSQKITTNILGSASGEVGGQEIEEEEGEGGLLGMIKSTIEKIKPKAPVITKINHYWGKVSTSDTEIISEITVSNPNWFPIYTSGIDYRIYMNDIEMARGRSISRIKIPSNGQKVIIVTTKIDNSKLPYWWVSHIKNDETTKVEIKGNIIFDVKITQVRLPLISYEKYVTTNILG